MAQNISTLDTIKVLMQTQDAKNPQYKNMVHCIKSIIAKESFHGLYRGMSSPMVINNRIIYLVIVVLTVALQL